MQTEQITAHDGHQIHTLGWSPSGEARAVVLIVHGLAEHSGRYRHVAQALTDAGYAVVAMDHRGHGQSGGVRALIQDFDLIVNDLFQVYEMAHARHPDLPVFLFGHSMGSLISLKFTLRYQEALAGFISEGTPLDVESTQPPVMIVVGRLLKSLAPRLLMPALEFEALSRDPEVVEAYASDPLVFTRGNRVGTAIALLDACKDVRQRLHTLTLPILILHGTADRITPASGSQFLYDQGRSSDKTLHMYEGFYHEAHNEPERARVLADIITWLNNH